MFGWAKPVPVAAWKFRDPRRGMALVAIAGPAMNFLLAWFGALLVPLPAGPGVDPLEFVLDFATPQPPIAMFLKSFILFNLVLGLFNLLPIPPLDGGRIAVGLLPGHLARYWARLERVGLLLVIFLVFLLPPLLREFGITFDPFRDALEVVVPGALRLLFYLAGDIGGGAEVQHV
jgi:Zn-dependent protease